MNHRTRPPQIHTYSLESGAVGNYDLRKAKFPRSTAIYGGYMGRHIACFNHDIFYRYAESSDGESLWSKSDPVMHQPISYRPPERDFGSYGTDNLISESQELRREFTYSNGIFELDDNHRIVTFEYPAEMNVNIVNMDTETSVSATDKHNLGIMLARNGLMYTLGDYEQLPSDEKGNRVLEVWQFHPFKSSHSETTR